MRRFLASAALSLVIALPFSGSQTGIPVSGQAWASPAPLENTVEIMGSFARTSAAAPLYTAPEAQTEPVALPEELKAMDVTTLKRTLLQLARPVAKPTKAEMCETLASVAQDHNLPVGFLVRLIQQESGFNPDAVSPVGAQGVAQFMPKVAEEWGLKNPFDPHQALLASARFLRSLYQQFGNWGLAAAAYNGGMGRVQKWVDKRGNLPEETRHYVRNITGVPAEQWVRAKTHRVSFTIPARAPCQEIAHLADAPRDEIPLPRPRETVKIAQASAAASNKTAGKTTVVTVKRNTQVAVITVRSASKVSVVTAKIAAPASIVADNRSAGTQIAAGKHQGSKEKAPAKVAEKTPAKTAAKPKDAKKASATGGVQIAEAQPSRD